MKRYTGKVDGVRYEMKWFGSECEKKTNKEMASRLNLAAQFVRSFIVKLISTSYFASGPSKPGEPPHARTGRLRNSIVIDEATPDSLSAKIGSTVEYALPLEEGSKRIAARPFFKPAVAATMEAVRKILGMRTR